MARIRKQTELETEIEKLHRYCEEHDIPVFIAVWDKRIIDNKNNGYLFSLHSPLRMRRDMEKETGIPDKFARILGAIMGFDRDDYEV